MVLMQPAATDILNTSEQNRNWPNSSVQQKRISYSRHAQKPENRGEAYLIRISCFSCFLLPDSGTVLSGLRLLQAGAAQQEQQALRKSCVCVIFLQFRVVDFLWFEHRPRLVFCFLIL